MDHRYCRQEGAVVLEMGWGKREREMHKKNISPKPLAWKMREAEFQEFLKRVGLKA